MASNLPDPAAGNLASFIPQSGLVQGGALAVRSPVVRIGQGTQNEIAIDDDTVSTRHAQLEFAAGAWKLTDLGSKNGTYLEGLRLEPDLPVVLNDGANVRFGAVKLQFVAHPEADVETARVAYTAPEVKRPLAERSRPRLPVWLLLLIILIIVAVVLIVLNLGGQPQTVAEGLQVNLFIQAEWSNWIAA